MGLGEEGIGLCALDVLDAQAEVIRLIDRVRMNLPRLRPSYPSVAAVQALIIVIPPLVLRFERVGVPRGLENAILVDILHLQARHSLSLLCQFGWTAPLNRLTQDLLSPILPGVAPLAIDITDLQGITNKISTIIRNDLPSRGQSVLRTQRIHISLAPKLDGLGPRSLDIPHEERIGCLIDMPTPIGDGLDVGRQGKIGRCCALGDEHLGRSACDIVLQEG